MEQERDDLSFFWQVPAFALLTSIAVVIVMATARGRIGSVAGRTFEYMFYITPAVGILVLLTLLGLLIFQPALLKRINLRATIALSILDVISPVVLFVLGAILSGFLR